MGVVSQYFQYPPDLFNLMVDAIAFLFRSKKDVLLFFQGAGVAQDALMDLWKVVRSKPDSIRMREIARTVLTRMNEGGDVTLRQRREILRRVTELESFSSCYPENELKARGVVAEIRRIVNVKDSFTRMHLERETEAQQRRAEHERKLAKRTEWRDELAAVKADLYGLFSETDPHRRGKAMEAVLNRLFRVSGLLVREAFTVVGDEGEGVVEQIDGVVSIDGDFYLVEMKWWNKPLGPSEVSQHLLRIYHRDQARAIIISTSGFTDAALKICKDALTKTVVVCCDLEEIVRRLEREDDLSGMIRGKIQAAIVDRNPYLRFGEYED